MRRGLRSGRGIGALDDFVETVLPRKEFANGFGVFVGSSPFRANVELMGECPGDESGGVSGLHDCVD